MAEFNRNKLKIAPLCNRTNDLDLSDILTLNHSLLVDGKIKSVANRIKTATENNSAIVLMMGAHVIRSGVQRYLINMMEKGLLNCIAINGAGVIHDYEFALTGKTTESVARYITDGSFGLWKETGRINDIVTTAMKKKLGLGEAVGKIIQEERFPNREISILAAGYRLGIPVTVHVGIGYDIVYELPNCNGAAYGATSYTDFLRFTHILESLQGGVVMNFGSAVMAPEIFLKALSMVRNVARQNGHKISKFTTLVCDLHKIPQNFHNEVFRQEALYYYRPWKTMLVRIVADGGESFYVQGRHIETVPQLWTALMNLENNI